MDHAGDDRRRADDFRRALDRAEVNEALRERSATRSDERTFDTPTTVAGPMPASPPPRNAPRPATGPVARDLDADGVPDRFGPATTYPARPTTERARIVRSARSPAPFSLAAGFFGWIVAAFFSVVFVTLALGAVGGVAVADGGALVVTGDLVTAGAIATLVAVLLAFAVGGYVAGRMGIERGAVHGASVVGWGVLFVLLGYLVSATTTGNLASLQPYLAPYNVDLAALTTVGVIALVITLVVAVAGAIVGGILGERWWTPERVETIERRVGGHRGRPS